MRNLYRIIRFLLVSLLSLTVGIPILLYVLLSFGGVHNKIRNIAQTELSELLGTEVAIRQLTIVPFSRLEFQDVSITLGQDTVLSAGILNAGISVNNLLLHRRIVVTDVELIRPDIRLWRATPDSALNVRPIFDRLKGSDNKEPTQFNLEVQTVALRGGHVCYNVVSESRREGFDPNHIELNDLRADISAPAISNARIRANLKRLDFIEQSGLTLRNLAAEVDYRPDTLNVNGLNIRLGNSHLAFADTKIYLAKDAGRIADIEILRGSTLAPKDLAFFIPQLASLPATLELSGQAELMKDSLSLRSLNLRAGTRLDLQTAANASPGLAHIPGMDLAIRGEDIAAVANAFRPLPSRATELLQALGNITFSGSGSWHKPQDVVIKGLIGSDIGSAEVDAQIAEHRLSGNVAATEINLGEILPGKQLGAVSFIADFDLAKTDGRAKVDVEALEWHGHRFHNIAAAGEFAGKVFEVTLTLADSLATVDLDAAISLTSGDYSALVTADVEHLDLNALGLWKKYPDYKLTAKLHADLRGTELMRPAGRVDISDINFRNREGEGVRLAAINLTTDLAAAQQYVYLRGDLLDGDITGNINLQTLPGTINNILAEALPTHFAPKEIPDSTGINDLKLNAVIKETSPIFAFVKTPVKPLYPINLAARLSQSENIISAKLSAPYLQQGKNKLIHGVDLTAMLGKESTLAARAFIPSKKGDTALDISGSMVDGLANILANWKVDYVDNYSGHAGLTIRPLAEGADIRILPGEMVFNNAAWEIEPTFIGLRNGAAVIGNLHITRPGQEAIIGGVVSHDPSDRLSIRLDNIDLDYIFETLQLGPSIMFGGMATGTVYGSGLLGSEPVLQTSNLYVSNFSYGGCVMGNANILSRWNNATHGIEIQANIPGHTPHMLTEVDGVINPLSEELDFVFRATHSPVGFLKPIMATFASNVKGSATGRLHLFGDFKHVDLEGDAAAEDFAMTIAFTGVTYHASDTIRIRPGLIDLKNITVSDSEGHTARLNGSLRHKFFKDLTFDFNVGNARSLLVYDMPQNDDYQWYGRVFGSGNVNISGMPGYVKIAAAMSTAPKTEFAFALSSREDAAEYNFLTFRDATPRAAADTLPPTPGSPELLQLMQAKLDRRQELDATSNYDFDFQIDVTPEAKMVLIMDPTAGDSITAYGAGHVGILYGSGNDDLRMYGDYRISRGNYNFSLQDIILKDFTIRDGSEISFHGNPLDANLNISATYRRTANLSDLDESFLNDKEVQRTNVPVDAVLNVAGSIQEPQISFDLDFPTLSSDVKRKVAAIVSTEEMMNRQIIYLLALDRFYTPDYMNATKGNELASVATGTISSQLSNILGQLSDKISVAPSVRSDAGNFSDMEFDVALSSTLLNNRLLLNGNFGYRDKSLNNNQFIGDFDLEYLLTRSGAWRLKAYNHFNDRNFYVKTALTTQGIGIVFKHDFDRLKK